MAPTFPQLLHSLTPQLLLQHSSAAVQVMALRGLRDLVAQAGAGAERIAAGSTRAAAVPISLHSALEVLRAALTNRSIFCRHASNHVGGHGWK